jgi:hypothetical protein
MIQRKVILRQIGTGNTALCTHSKLLPFAHVKESKKESQTEGTQVKGHTLLNPSTLEEDEQQTKRKTQLVVFSA